MKIWVFAVYIITNTKEFNDGLVALSFKMLYNFYFVNTCWYFNFCFESFGVEAIESKLML